MMYIGGKSAFLPDGNFNCRIFENPAIFMLRAKSETY